MQKSLHYSSRNNGGDIHPFYRQHIDFKVFI